jgi:hypothetical protein
VSAHRCSAILALSLWLLLSQWAEVAHAQSSKATPQPTPLPSNPAVTTPTSPPPPAIGSPMSPLSPIAPLSPQITTTPLTGGSVTTRVPSPSPLSTSPSEAAPSAPGGGGRTLGDCVKFWDRESHMMKSEWRAACQRSLTRLDNLKIDDVVAPPKKKK